MSVQSVANCEPAIREKRQQSNNDKNKLLLLLLLFFAFNGRSPYFFMLFVFFFCAAVLNQHNSFQMVICNWVFLPVLLFSQPALSTSYPLYHNLNSFMVYWHTWLYRQTDMGIIANSSNISIHNRNSVNAPLTQFSYVSHFPH